MSRRRRNFCGGVPMCASTRMSRGGIKCRLMGNDGEVGRGVDCVLAAYVRRTQVVQNPHSQCRLFTPICFIPCMAFISTMRGKLGMLLSSYNSDFFASDAGVGSWRGPQRAAPRNLAGELHERDWNSSIKVEPCNPRVSHASVGTQGSR